MSHSDTIEARRVSASERKTLWAQDSRTFLDNERTLEDMACEVRGAIAETGWATMNNAPRAEVVERNSETLRRFNKLIDQLK